MGGGPVGGPWVLSMELSLGGSGLGQSPLLSAEVLPGTPHRPAAPNPALVLGERGDADYEVLAFGAVLDPQLVGQLLQRAADLGELEAFPQAGGATVGHRPDLEL